MSANLTVSWMAAEAERPLRLRQAEHARRVAEAEASAPPRAGALRTAGRRLAAGNARPWRRLLGTGPAAAARAAPVVHEAG